MVYSICGQDSNVGTLFVGAKVTILQYKMLHCMIFMVIEVIL